MAAARVQCIAENSPEDLSDVGVPGRDSSAAAFLSRASFSAVDGHGA